MKRPYPYQRDAIARIIDTNLLLADECGLGKTMMAIESSRHLPTGPRLVVCPSRAKEQWREEIIDQFPDATVFVLGPAGSLPSDFKWSMLESSEPTYWVVTHYETLLRIGSELSWVDWTYIIMDEAHRIKNRKAKRTLWANRLRAYKKVCLTGTPIEKTPADMWALLHFLHPKQFTSYWAFVGQFVLFEEHPWWDFKKPIGVKNPEHMAQVIGPYFLRRSKQEVMPDLPPRIIHHVPLTMDGPQARAYDQIDKAKDIEVPLDPYDTGETEIELTIVNALSRIIRLQQVSVDPSILGIDVPSSKLSWLEEYLEDNPEEVIVIFSRFRPVAQKIANKYQCPLVVGGMRNPSSAIAAWQSGQHRLITGTLDAMGEALNLQRASTAIFLEEHWSSRVMTQALDRIHRVNIKEAKHMIYLYNEGTVDELVRQALEKKWSTRDLANRFFDKYRKGEL
jgi:SNF2 family DNA or RNA helicase